MTEHAPHGDTPAIFIALDQIDETTLKQLFWGIEEEGVPYKRTPSQSEDLTAEAFAAASNSLLGIGIACNQHKIVLHTRNLSPDTPLFEFALNSETEKRQLRHLGCNAARLVKGLPLKSISKNA